MWKIEAIERREGDEPRGTQLLVDDVVLCDGVELVRWGDDALHLFHCEMCGGDDRPGGWVTPRRAGELVVWLPVFAKLEGDDAWARDEYAPPEFVLKRGVPLFMAEAAIVELPVRSVPPLTAREAIKMLQLESVDVLGPLSMRPSLQRPWIITTSEPDLDLTLDRFEALIDVWSRSDDPVDLRPLAHQADTPEANIWFWIDPGDGRDWWPLVKHENALGLRFEAGGEVFVATKRGP